MPSKELDSLRSEARHSERLVSAKIRRMAKREDGYDVSGTKLDPRKPKGWIDRANSIQLKKYIADMKYFRRPSIGWVSSMYGEPIRRQVIKNYEASARTRNKNVDKVEGKIAKIFVPWAGTSAKEQAESRARKSAKTRRMNNEQNVRSKIPEKAFARNFSSESAAIRFAKHNRELDSERVIKLKQKQIRNEVREMLDGSSIAAKLDKLTDDQLWFAWTSSPHMAASAKLVYLFMTGQMDFDGVYDNELSRLELIVEGASKIHVPEGAFYA